MYHLILLFLIFPWSWWGGRPHFVIQACRYERGGVRIRWSFSFWSLPTKNWWNSNIWKKTKDPPALWVWSWREFCSVLWEVGQTRILLATLCLAFFCGGVSQTIVGNWRCTSIEFRIVLVIGRFVFHCIRLWKRFSLSVQDLFLQTMWCDCFVYFCVFCIVVLLFPTFWEFVWCRVQHLCKPEIAGNLGGRRKTKNSNKPKLKRQIQSLKWEQRKTWKWFKLLTCSEAVTRSFTFTTQANAF